MGRSNSFYCNKNHNIKDYAGEVEVIDRKGIVHSYLIPIAYCVSCDEYYILEETFEELKRKGIIRCNILKYKQHIGLKKKICKPECSMSGCDNDAKEDSRYCYLHDVSYRTYGNPDYNAVYENSQKKKESNTSG